MGLDFSSARTASSSKKRAQQASNMTKGSIVIQISVDDIMENPLNEGMPCEDIDLLANSIIENGLIEPVNVYDMKTGKYMLYSGHRRLLASKLAGLKTIPALVKEYPSDPEKRFIDHTAANAQRKKDTRFYLAEIRNARAIIQEKFPGIKKKEEMQKISEMIGYGMSVPQIYRYEGMKDMAPELLILENSGLSAATMYLAKGLSAKQQKNVAKRCRAILAGSHDNDEDDLETKGTITRTQFKALVDLEKGAFETPASEAPVSVSMSNVTAQPTVYEEPGHQVNEVDTHAEDVSAPADETDKTEPVAPFAPQTEQADTTVTVTQDGGDLTFEKPERQRSKVLFREKLSEKEGDLLRLLARANPDVPEEREAVLRTIDSLTSIFGEYRDRFSS